MVHGTAFGEMTGKFILGSPVDCSGIEQALAGKIIGEAPAVSYPEFDVRLPERGRLAVSPMAGFIVGAIVGVLIEKFLK